MPKKIQKVVARGRTPKFQGSKTDFIKTQPASLSNPEVVVIGKKAGVTLTAGYVANVRGMLRAKRSTKKKSSDVLKTKVKAQTEAAFKSDGSDSTFRALVLQIGVSRAEGILKETRELFGTVYKDLGL